MDKTLFAICILIYAAVVIFLADETKRLLSATPTFANKIYATISGLVYIAAIIYITSMIKDDVTIRFRDMSGNPFTFGAIIGYIFIWFVFYVLYGSILTVLMFIPHTVYVFVKYPNTTARSKLPDSLNVDMWPSMYAAGSALAYNLILYAFGLTDYFFPIFGF